MYLLIALLLTILVLFAFEVRRKNIHIWILDYLRKSKPSLNEGPVHIMFCFVDHYEPMWSKPTYETEVLRVRSWTERYPILAKAHKDFDGIPPQHTFFYPEEEYRKEHLDELGKLCKAGFGEVEVHLHHDHDTEFGLREKINRFVKTLHETHGMLSIDPVSKKPVFGFIHGNWSLDNSRADGRWCGVNNELNVLKDLGCYADFTLPSAPSETQTAKVNSLYYAFDDPEKAKSHNTGCSLSKNTPAQNGLPILQGPLALNWRTRKWGLFPKIENSDIRASFPPTNNRVDMWINQHIHVTGQPNWIFVKIHTHGTQDHDIETLLGPPVDQMHSYLEEKYNDGKNHALHYVTAREMFNIVKAAEAGKTGNPNNYRDFILKKPGY